MQKLKEIKKQKQEFKSLIEILQVTEVAHFVKQESLFEFIKVKGSF